MVESSYFPKSEFQEALARYVRLRINTSGSTAEWGIYDRYAHGEALPTYAVLDPDGTLVSKTGWEGGLHADRTLLAWLKAHAR